MVRTMEKMENIRLDIRICIAWSDQPGICKGSDAKRFANRDACTDLGPVKVSEQTRLGYQKDTWIKLIWLNTAKTLNKCSIDILGTKLVLSRSYPFCTRELAVDWETITSTTHTELFSRGCLLENPELTDCNSLPATMPRLSWFW